MKQVINCNPCKNQSIDILNIKNTYNRVLKGLVLVRTYGAHNLAKA